MRDVTLNQPNPAVAEEIAALRPRAADFVETWASQFPASRFIDVDGTPDNALMQVRPDEMNDLVASAMAAAIHSERTWLPHSDGCDEGDEEGLGHCAPDCPKRMRFEALAASRLLDGDRPDGDKS